MIQGIVLAGGSGKRLWPLSREKKPKQLLKLFLEKTFIESSVSRISSVADKVSISTGQTISDEIKQILPNINLIIEPDRRDTAAAIALCATQFDSNDILVFTPADAYISPDYEFTRTIKNGINLVEKENGIVVIGIKPTFPSTQYGYLEPANDRSTKIVGFKEKPNEETAKKYFSKGFLWNAGIFISRAGEILDLVKSCEPEMYADLIKIKNGGNINSIYPTLKAISFDYAVMEKAKNVRYVPATFSWNDIGNFSAISEVVRTRNVSMGGKLIEKDSLGNIVSTFDSKKSVALLGCEDLVVIDTPDALLVCPKKFSGQIKKFVEKSVPFNLQ
jgi:mannose-1-phosphate guanylyltransferase